MLFDAIWYDNVIMQMNRQIVDYSKYVCDPVPIEESKKVFIGSMEENVMLTYIFQKSGLGGPKCDQHRKWIQAGNVNNVVISARLKTECDREMETLCKANKNAPAKSVTDKHNEKHKAFLQKCSNLAIVIFQSFAAKISNSKTG